MTVTREYIRFKRQGMTVIASIWLATGATAYASELGLHCKHAEVMQACCCHHDDQSASDGVTVTSTPVECCSSVRMASEPISETPQRSVSAAPLIAIAIFHHPQIARAESFQPGRFHLVPKIAGPPPLRVKCSLQI